MLSRSSRLALVALLPLLPLTSIVACGGESTTAPSVTSIVGTYSLRAPLASTGDTLVSEVITLRADSTMSYTQTWAASWHAPRLLTARGRWGMNTVRVVCPEGCPGSIFLRLVDENGGPSFVGGLGIVRLDGNRLQLDGRWLVRD